MNSSATRPPRRATVDPEITVMKSQQRVYLLAVSILLLLAGPLFFASHAKEPRYEGKTAPQWFRQFRKNKPSYMTSGGIAMMMLSGGVLVSNNVVQVVDEQRFSKDPAADALRNLGTNSAL